MPNLYPFLTYVLVTTFTPGPNNILSMSNAMRHGYRRSQGLRFGMAAGFGLLLLICGLLNVALARYIPQVHYWLNLLGAAYLIYLAVHIMLARTGESGPAPERLNSFGAGFALQFVNLKGILYAVTVFALFITPVYQNPVVVSLFAVLLAGVGFLAVSSWALGGNVFRSFLSRYERWFNLAMAALLVYTAVASLLASHA
jgi:threonine/homoserine/homoserine lactone efflux protein